MASGGSPRRDPGTEEREPRMSLSFSLCELSGSAAARPARTPAIGVSLAARPGRVSSTLAPMIRSTNRADHKVAAIRTMSWIWASVAPSDRAAATRSAPPVELCGLERAVRTGAEGGAVEVRHVGGDQRALARAERRGTAHGRSRCGAWVSSLSAAVRTGPSSSKPADGRPTPKVRNLATGLHRTPTGSLHVSLFAGRWCLRPIVPLTRPSGPGATDVRAVSRSLRTRARSSAWCADVPRRHWSGTPPGR